MNTYEFSTFLAGAIAVFLLASLVYRRHIRRPRMFLWAMGLFIGGLIVIEGSDSLRPSSGLGMRVIPLSRSFVFLTVVGRWILYASLPVFFVACSGSTRTFAQCSRCGYDLTGNNSGVCPECGGKLDDS